MKRRSTRKGLDSDRNVAKSYFMLDQSELESRHHELHCSLIIDKHNLDEAIIKQPQLYFEVSSMLASLIDARDASKENLSRVDANIATELRVYYEKEGTKFTQSSIAEEVLQDQKHFASFNEFNICRRNVNSWSSLKEAYEQRARMLSHITKLWVSQYFSESVVSGDYSNKVNRNALTESRRKRRVKDVCDS